MTEDTIKWLVGLFVTGAGMLGATIAGLRRSIQNGDDKLAAQMRDADNQLHERVNRVRDEYVKRADFDATYGRIEARLAEMRTEQKEMSRLILERLPSPPSRRQ